jgi:arsenate reductase
MSAITIYHNPACGTSRNTLELIRNSGVEPTVILYLETPPARAELVTLIADMGICVRDLLRKNVEPYEQLGLAEDKWSDDELIDFMLQHPILINRPVVVTLWVPGCAVRLRWCWIFCRMHKRERSAKRTANR